MTNPRWVGVRRGDTTVVLDRETGCVTVTSEPRRDGWLEKQVAIPTTTEG